MREYHKKFYRAENLKVIITGNVNPEAVFKALAPLEEKIIAKVHFMLFYFIFKPPILFSETLNKKLFFRGKVKF